LSWLVSFFFKYYLFQLSVLKEEVGKPNVLNNVPETQFLNAYLAAKGIITLSNQAVIVLSLLVKAVAG